jgi:hypothetical protein
MEGSEGDEKRGEGEHEFLKSSRSSNQTSDDSSLNYCLISTS